MPKAVAITGTPGKPGQVYYPLSVITVPATGPPTGNQLVVRMLSASLNHRDLFIRQHLYPGTAFQIPLLADGCGTVVDASPDPAAQKWLGKRVVINPGTGWNDSPDGPEEEEEGGGGGYRILGGTKHYPTGTLQEYMLVDAGEVEEAPEFLSHIEAAALPLTGLTAWRAVTVKVGERNLGKGKNVLVTGIGGGVALMALCFASRTGAGVWVTSGNEEKIAQAVSLGARGGVNYREEGWEKKLLRLLRQEVRGGRAPYFDAIVDGAGGDIVEKGFRILKPGGVIVSYGMTLGSKMPFLMHAVLKNIELKGSTMGSRKEFKDMLDFITRERVKPVISRTVQGLDNIQGIDSLFEDMKKGCQFGKLVIDMAGENGNVSKL